MKKYGLYLASLAFAAFLAILAACGSGEVVELTDPKNGMKNLFEAIEWCLDGKEVPNFDCEALLTEYGKSSSSEDDGGDSSPSYSSPGEDPDPDNDDSSSSAAPSSSSLYINPNAYKVPPFTCSWEPNDLVTGDNAEIKIEFTEDEPEVDCFKGGFIETEKAKWGNDGEADSVFFEAGDEIRIAGIVKTKENKDWTWPTSDKVSIKGLVLCPRNGEDVGHRVVEDCSLNIKSAPEPTINIEWTGGTSSASDYIYTLAQTPKVMNVKVDSTGKDGVHCDASTFKVEFTGTAAGVAKTVSMSTSITSASSNMPTADGTVVAKASVECRGTPYSKTINATVNPWPDYPKPTIGCKWERYNPETDKTDFTENAYYETEGGANGGDRVTPIVSITNDTKSGCKTAVFKGHADFNGPATGGRGNTVTLNKKTTYTGVSVDVTCEASQTTTKIFNQTCNSLDVTLRPSEEEGGNVGNCAYRWEWCNNWPMEIVKSNFTATTYIRNVCLFAKTVSKLGAATYTVNGISYQNTNVNNSINNFSSNPSIQAKDGGYYIWVPNVAVNSGDFVGTHGAPDCTPGTPTNAVAICKSHCTDKVDKALTSALEKGKEYELRVYGQEACSNLRHNGSTCQFQVNEGTTISVGSNSNIANVGLNDTPKIKYVDGCGDSVQLYCN